MVAHCAPAGGAAPSPARARPVSSRRREAPDVVLLLLLPRASQAVEKLGERECSSDMRPPPAKKKKQGNMTGDQWAAAHGAAWQQFLQEKLKKCECTNPRTSRSNRRLALKEDDGVGIMPGEPAACLLCFAPVDKEVRPPTQPYARPAGLARDAARAVLAATGRPTRAAVATAAGRRRPSRRQRRRG